MDMRPAPEGKRNSKARKACTDHGPDDAGEVKAPVERTARCRGQQEDGKEPAHPTKCGHAAQPQFVVNRRIATDHRACSNVIGNPALRSGNGPVAYFAVSSNANLASKNYVVPHIG